MVLRQDRGHLSHRGRKEPLYVYLEYKKTIVNKIQVGEILGVIWAVFAEPQRIQFPICTEFYHLDLPW